MGCPCFGSSRRTSKRGERASGTQYLITKDSIGSSGLRTEMLARNLASVDFNDAIIKRGSNFSLYSSSQRSNTLTYSSLLQVVKYKVGNELLCMSWNLNHMPHRSPFDFYSDFRDLEVPDREVIIIQILWDVARVFLSTDRPTEFNKRTKLKSVVPSDLLSYEVLISFCAAAKIPDKEREIVLQFCRMTLNEFMLALTYDKDLNQILHDGSSFFKLHQRFYNRASNPLIPQYNSNAYKRLLHQEPSMLPVLILDSLYALMIRFSSFLLYNDLQQAFSAYHFSHQIDRLSLYCSQNNPNDLSLPKTFVDIRNILCQMWKTVFGGANKVRQVLVKMERSNADIVLLQNITRGVFQGLKSGLRGVYLVFPDEFPSEVKNTSIICLKKTTVSVEKENKTCSINHCNFAVLCRSSDILYYVAVVSLTAGKTNGKVRKKEVTRFKRLLGKATPVIMGGYFDEDLTSRSNPIAQIMLKKYNGIDHNQELECTINPTKTNLQYYVTKLNENVKIVDSGIFSSFPFAGDASTDFLYPGKENPCDCGPILQRLLCLI